MNKEAVYYGHGTIAATPYWSVASVDGTKETLFERLPGGELRISLKVGDHTRSHTSSVDVANSLKEWLSEAD